METNEETTLDENDVESTQIENADSEESENLDDIFEDESDENDSDKDDKIKNLEEKISRLEKGIQKFATEKGQEKKEVKDSPKQESSPNDEIVEELLLTKHPEAEHVLDELKETAQLKGVSVLRLYRESKYFQGEAKAISETKKVEEENRSKIKSPTNGVSSKKVDISAVKAEDVDKLSREDKVKWLRSQAEKERNIID